MIVSAEPTTETGEVSIDGRPVPFIETVPADADESPAAQGGSPIILLLHGVAFGPANWDEAGVMEVLASAGNRVVAIALPEEGQAPAIRPPHGLDA